MTTYGFMSTLQSNSAYSRNNVISVNINQS